MDKSKKRTSQTLKSPLTPQQDNTKPKLKSNDVVVKNDIDGDGTNEKNNFDLSKQPLTIANSEDSIQSPTTTDEANSSTDNENKVEIEKNNLDLSKDEKTVSIETTNSQTLSTTIDDTQNKEAKTDRIMEIFNNLNEIATEDVDNDNMNTSGLFWNSLVANEKDSFLNITPENILVNFIFQAKLCCSFFANDDLFNYLSFSELYLQCMKNDVNLENNELEEYEISNGDLLMRFSTTNNIELLLRALLLSKEAVYKKPTLKKQTLQDMKKYENLFKSKIILNGCLNDWQMLKSLFVKLMKRSELVLTCKEQSKTLCDILFKLNNLTDKIIEHKLNIVNGQFWDNLIWYHYDTFQFSGILCDLALTESYKFPNSTIDITRVLPESIEVDLINIFEKGLIEMPTYRLATISKEQKFKPENLAEIPLINSQLCLYKLKTNFDED